MNKLVDTLKSQTASLRTQYLELTKTWAEREFLELRQWAKEYDSGTYGFGEASKKWARLPHYIVNSYGTVEQHVEKMLTNAEKHYDASIEKLAYRILLKGLDPESIQLETSHIGVNIETTITDGRNTVRAFTIIAGGYIQKPHYRYLIK